MLYHINLLDFHQYVVAVESHQNDEEYRGNGLRYVFSNAPVHQPDNAGLVPMVVERDARVEQ